MNTRSLRSMLKPLPLIAILRGVDARNVIPVVEVLFNEGFRVFEIPLNSPNPHSSIELIRHAFGERLIVGAGTVLTEEEVISVDNAGGQVIVSPNYNREVIKKTKSLGMCSIPGVNTPSEAFASLKAGADMLKIFPAEIIPPIAIKAWRAILNPEVWLLPVGGITTDHMAAYFDAGVNGFGIGSSLFKPEYEEEYISKQAQLFVKTFQSIFSRA